VARGRKPPGTKSEPTAAQTVQRVLNQTNPGWLDHQDRMNRFNRAYDIYRGNVTPSKSLKPWQSQLYVKYGMQVIDQALVNIVQGAPKPICKPRREQDEFAAKAMEVVLSYYADKDHLPEKEPLVCAQALVYGVSPGKTFWYYREADKSVPVESQDPLTGTAFTDQQMRKVVESDRPCFVPWNVYDFWWDPYARDVESAQYVVFRDWLTKEQLEDRRFYEDLQVGTYRNLDHLFASGPGNFPPQTAQNNMIPQPTNPYKDRFEILEIWQDNHMTVVGNRQTLLYDGKKPFWMPGKPAVISNVRPDMFKIEGISETELIDHLQQALHMVTNLRMDNMKFTVMRGATYREGGVSDPNTLVMRPAFLWPVQDHDDVQFHDAPQLPPEAYQEEETLLGRLQYVTGISPYVTGATGTGVDQNTATGVTLLHESASRLLGFKANQIRLNTWQRVFEQWADLTRQFMTDQMSVQIQGQDGKDVWANIGPNEIMGDYDVRIEAGEEALSRQQERAEAIAILNALAPFAQAGLVNMKPLLEKVADSYNLKNRSALFPTPQPQAAPGGQQAPNAPTPQMAGQNGSATMTMPQPAQAFMSGNAR
jgi:hypothetical protein